MLRPRDAAVRLIVLAAVLALLPVALATLAFGHAFRASETGRVDARLASATRLAIDAMTAAESDAVAAAQRLASKRDVQVALARNDRASLARYASRARLLTLVVSPPSAPLPSARDTITRSISVVSARATIGRVDATVRLDPLLDAIGDKTHTELVLARHGGAGPAGGPVGRGYDVRVGGTSYRALRTPATDAIDVVASVRASAIDATVRHRQLLTLGAAALTIAALALGAVVLAQRRGTRGRHRSPLALVGDVVAAAHDVRALLPVILETAIAATDAVGGRVDWDGERIATIGEQGPVAGRLGFPLDEDEPDGRQLLLYPPRGGFTATDREVADALAAQGRIALENARLHSVVRRQAVTDELTDLANRRRFMEVLQQEVARAARFESPLALTLFDLDHFKQINDRCGHQAGDDVLRATAEVIRARVRETDLPARIGGEEFAVILSGTDLAGACAVAEKLRRDLSREVHVVGAEGPVTASFGVAVLHQGDSAELLIGAADRALYRAKAEGRNRVCVAEAEAPAA